jgi:hypothetical protein
LRPWHAVDTRRSLKSLALRVEHRLIAQIPLVLTVDNPEIAKRLQRSIKGRGAFRCFKDTLIDHDMLDCWHTYEHQRKLEYGREWLESIGITPA